MRSSPSTAAIRSGSTASYSDEARRSRTPPASVDQRAKRAWKTAGLASIGLHEARHTYASYLIAAGVDMKAISEYMGHTSVAFTYDRYGHLLPGSTAENAAKLDAYLARSRSHSRSHEV